MNAAQPSILTPNQPDRPYRGGAGIADFRGIPQRDEWCSEDFVGSTVEVFGGGAGPSALPDGGLLRDAVAADPEGWLGAAHVARFGAQPQLLVKLLDTGERLFVHLHPDDATAQRELGSPVGKTECWLVIGVRDAGPGSGDAWVGFREEVDPSTLAHWVAQQDAAAMLAAMNRVHVAVGETLLVPAGVPHAVGPGITVVELQQPSDLSLLLEWTGYAKLDPTTAFLGLPRDTALAAVDRSAWADRVDGLRGELAPGVRALPAAADPFFRADVVRDGGWTASFAIVVGVEGEGSLRWDGAEGAPAGELPMRRGDTAVVPFAAGDVRVEGGFTAIVCRPPLPGDGA